MTSRVGKIGRGLAGAVSDLTDGQRWTIGLILVITALFVTFGLRGGSAIVPFAAGEFTPPVTSTTVSTASTTTTTTTTASTAPVPTTAKPSTEIKEPAAAVPPATVASPVQVVAVVRTDQDSQTGRDDAAIASVFIGDLDGRVRIVELADAEASLCGEAFPRRIVVAGEALPAKVRDCVVESGAVLISHDDRGSSATSLSTALGATAAFVDAARVVGSDHSLGLVVGPTLEAEADAAQAILEDEGFTVTTAAVEPRDNASTASAMLSFAADDVDTVVFGVEVAEQIRWLSLARALRMDFDHVVGDVADSIVNESYPDEVVGIRAVAATRVAWFEREHGETGPQRDCRERFEAATGSTVTSRGELIRVLLWCQHVAVAQVIAEAGGSLSDVPDLSFDSPITSALVSDTETGFAPREVALLDWQPDCSCWAEALPFRTRGRVS